MLGAPAGAGTAEGNRPGGPTLSPPTSSLPGREGCRSGAGLKVSGSAVVIVHTHSERKSKTKREHKYTSFNVHNDPKGSGHILE